MGQLKPFFLIKATFCLMSLLLACAGDAYGARGTVDHQPTDTVGKVRATGKVAIGFREFSVPFSFRSGSGEPIGYSIDLCRAIVDAIARRAGREVAIDWVKVTSDSRIDAVSSGEVDLECGSTTSNAERSKRVMFSPIIFVAGTKLMVPRESPIKSFRDLEHRIVSVTSGTTNEKTMHDLRNKFNMNYSVVASDDHEASLELLLQGKVDAFATDDVLLSGLMATRKLTKEYRIIGEFLSYDPYGIMYRKNDPELKRIVEATLHGMGQRHELDRVYDKWFMGRLPSGERIDLPMSPHLEAVFRSFGEKPR